MQNTSRYPGHRSTAICPARPAPSSRGRPVTKSRTHEAACISARRLRSANANSSPRSLLARISSSQIVRSDFFANASSRAMQNTIRVGRKQDQVYSMPISRHRYSPYTMSDPHGADFRWRAAAALLRLTDSQRNSSSTLQYGDDISSPARVGMRRTRNSYYRSTIHTGTMQRSGFCLI